MCGLDPSVHTKTIRGAVREKHEVQAPFSWVEDNDDGDVDSSCVLCVLLLALIHFTI